MQNLNYYSPKYLIKMQDKTMKFLQEKQIPKASIITPINKAFYIMKNDRSLKNNLIRHSAVFNSVFLFFLGWISIEDKMIPLNTLGHSLELFDNGLNFGLGFWKGECDIQLMYHVDEGVEGPDGTIYTKPKYYFEYSDKNDYENCLTGFKWLFENIKYFRYLYLREFDEPIPVIGYFNENDICIGISIPKSPITSSFTKGKIKVK